MTRRSPNKVSVLLAVLLAGAVSGPVVFAQPPAGRPGRSGPGMGGPRQMTVVQAPVAALKAGLKLTATQTAKIQSIQDRLRQQYGASLPRPGSGSNARPNQDVLRARFEKLHASADKDIRATLTATQKQALPALLKRLDVWRGAGIPAELYGTLSLTAGQQQKIAAIVNKARQAGGAPGAGRGAWGQSRQQVHSQAMAVLTASQRKTVTEYRNARRRPQSGRGPGGGSPPPAR